MGKWVCPVHGKKMTVTATRYGFRYDCPEKDCTVAGWGGSTSTPADAETRSARIQAHEAFDRLWKSGQFKRNDLYRALSEWMGTKRKQTHIGMFSKEQCFEVLGFVAHKSAEKLQEILDNGLS